MHANSSNKWQRHNKRLMVHQAITQAPKARITGANQQDTLAPCFKHLRPNKRMAFLSYDPKKIDRSRIASQPDCEGTGLEMKA